MSDCMIVRRGGVVGGGGSGGGEFDPAGAVLKVVTTTGCTAFVTNSTAGYSETHEQADGFARPNDASVTEHFFSIPASAFGTITVNVSKEYTNNGVTDTLQPQQPKTVTIDTAGKVYEVLIAAPNIILDNKFGLQAGYSLWNASRMSYSDRYKTITISSGYGGNLLIAGGTQYCVPVMPFTKITIVAGTPATANTIVLTDGGNVDVAMFNNVFYPSGGVEDSADITGQYAAFPNVSLRVSAIEWISKIMLE